MPRRRFTRELKEVALSKLASGTPAESVAESYHVDPAILRRWQKEWDEFGDRAFGGYGKSRRPRAEPRSRTVVLHLSTDELDAVKMACCASGFQTLAEFARSCLFHPGSEPPRAQAEKLLQEIGTVMGKLTEAIAQRQ